MLDANTPPADLLGAQRPLTLDRLRAVPLGRYEAAMDKAQNRQRGFAAAERICVRRKQLKITASYVAERLGVGHGAYKRWETRFGPASEANHLKALAEILKTTTDWIAYGIGDEPLDPACPMPDNTLPDVDLSRPESACAAEEIRAAAAWLSRDAFILRTSDYSSLSADEKREAGIFCMRYGVYGEDKARFESISDNYQVSGTRIRQIVSKLGRRARRMQIGTPIIDRIVAMITPMLPADIADLETIARPLLGNALTLTSLERFTREILWRAPFVITNGYAVNSVTPIKAAIDPNDHEDELGLALRNFARRMIGTSGAAQTVFIAGAAAAELERSVSPSDVARWCKLVAGFDWIDEEDGWFWFGPHTKNRVLWCAHKVLSAAQEPVSTDDILVAHARSRPDVTNMNSYDRPYRITPPHSVVESILERQPGIERVHKGWFRLSSPQPLDVVLSSTELAIYHSIRAAGGIVARDVLRNNLVVREGMDESTFCNSLKMSPVYDLRQRGLIALRGVRFKPEALSVALGLLEREVAPDASDAPSRAM